MARLDYNKGFEKFDQFLRALKTGLRPMATRTTYDTAVRISTLIKRKYEQVDRLTRRSGIGYAAQTLGKRIGAENPPRPNIAPEDVGMRLFIENVLVDRDAMGWYVTINPSAFHYAYRKSIYMLAHWTENPRPVQITRSLRMYVYQKFYIGEGKRGYRAPRKRDYFMSNKDFEVRVYNPRPRPVWRAVAKDLMSKDRRALYPTELFQWVRRLALRFGAF